jgi:hypothetical protein
MIYAERLAKRAFETWVASGKAPGRRRTRTWEQLWPSERFGWQQVAMAVIKEAEENPPSFAIICKEEDHA